MEQLPNENPPGPVWISYTLGQIATAYSSLMSRRNSSHKRGGQTLIRWQNKLEGVWNTLGKLTQEMPLRETIRHLADNIPEHRILAGGLLAHNLQVTVGAREPFTPAHEVLLWHALLEGETSDRVRRAHQATLAIMQEELTLTDGQPYDDGVGALMEELSSVVSGRLKEEPRIIHPSAALREALIPSF